MTDTINGTYGCDYTACTVFVFDGWYAVEGSLNVNRTDPSLLVEGVDVETLSDYDTFTAGTEIDAVSTLIQQVNL